MYDGTSNLILVADDNSGEWTGSPHMSCRVFDAPSQAIRVYNDSANYDPSAPSSYSGTVLGVKNQIMMHIESAGELIVIGDGSTATNNYLPSYSYFNYSLTQQIYTAYEIGSAGTIQSMAFYNGGDTKTRTYDFYLAHTDKASFVNNTDWVAVSEASKVFSGEVTMTADRWTIVNFDIPFEYDGISNLVLVADDNSGEWTGSPHMSCRVFNAEGYQSIRIYGDNINYDPFNPTRYSGTRPNVKNQIIFGIAPSTMQQTITLSQGWNWVSFNVEITLDDLKEALVTVLPGTTISIKSQTQNTSYNPNLNRWVGSLAWDVAKMYMIKVVAPCEITFEGLPINPSEHPVSILNGANWIGFPLNSSMTLSNAFAGFAINGDKIKSQTNNALYNGIRWQGQLNTLEPGKGYIYISNSSEGRVFTFPTSAK